ncbi:histidine kinase [Metarhizobium album]|uniref:Histidine kinase n=1 Tax=Metarhizobium album TaxID=2182425 RepID=A0A2U2DWB2_9HYPH|nr:EAL domain-containing protein [Rhizobium album]PWE57600.1 histidine kinase [Rhizobium album]
MRRTCLPDGDEETFQAQTRRLVAATEALLDNNEAFGDGQSWPVLAAALDQVSDQIYVKDLDSRFLFANLATVRTNRLESADQLIGKTDFDLFPADVAGGFYESEQTLLACGIPELDIEETLIAPDGRQFWWLTSKTPLRDRDGRVVGLIGIARDITTRKREEALRSGQANLLEMIARSEPLPAILEALVLLVEEQLDNIQASVLLLDPEGKTLHQGAAPSLPAGYNKLIDGVAIGPNIGSCGTAAWLGKPVIVSDVQTDYRWANFRDLAVQYGLYSCWSTPILTHQGNVLGTLALYSGSVRHPTENEMQLVAMATHIAGIAIERQRAEDRIHFMAHHDALTGLPNRTYFKDKIADVLHQAKISGQRVIVAYVDLDNFKQINDNYGHNAGDELLRHVAARMLEFTRASDLVVRLGGDEFVLVFANQARGEGDILPRLAELRRSISRPIVVDGVTIATTCSMGVASFPEDGETAEELIASADAAMYRAKELGRDSLQVHRNDGGSRVAERFNLQEELRTAIAGGQLFLDYQPQIDLASGHVRGVEALVRWNHPRLGVLAPGSFIALAEECGLILPLGLWVLKTACRQNKRWHDLGLPPVVMAVNVSPRQFCDPMLIDQVSLALKDSGLEPQFLELELTENAISQDVPRALATMAELEKLGIRLTIDDFGTGYANLAALKTFPVRRLKMDRSFVEALPHDPTMAAIASAVISLARGLNLSVVAEGVENAEQMAYLRHNGCDEVQGFHFSRPVAPESIERLLAAPPA